MKDYFKEQLVVKEVTKQDRNKKIGIFVVAAVLILFIYELITSVAYINTEYYSALMLLMIVIAVLIIALAIRMANNINKEFEYAYTSGNLDIDVIYNRRKRKRVFSGYVEEFEVMAPIDDGQHLFMYDNVKTKDFSSGKILENTYVFVSVFKGKKRKFVIEPCNDILKAMRTDLPPGRMFVKNNYIK